MPRTKTACTTCGWVEDRVCTRGKEHPSSPRKCPYFVRATDVTRVARVFKRVRAHYDGRWLGKDPNLAFLIAVGAGPWKENRREKVQGEAIAWFVDQKLEDLSQVHVDDVDGVYPFEWQNAHLRNMIASLQEPPTPPLQYGKSHSFASLCHHWKVSHARTEFNPWGWRGAVAEVFRRCQVTPAGTKVLWMWIRDYLGLPAFPIDRWVSRNLENYHLPKDAWQMVHTCLLAGVNPNVLNRSFFTAGNPTWG